MIRKHIPNFITSLNVFCGSLAVVFSIRGELTIAVGLILLAAVFDFLDGMVARLLHAYSPVGKELDSLADVISFGLAPGLIVFKLQESILFDGLACPDSLSSLSLYEIVVLGSAFLIPVFSALRLAKFNVDERQTSSFIGLPTPANAIFISSLALIYEHPSRSQVDHLLLSTPGLLILTLLFSYLLISELPMFSLKFKNLSWKNNSIQYLFLILSICLIAFFGLYGITLTILLFILLSAFAMVYGKK